MNYECSINFKLCILRNERSLHLHGWINDNERGKKCIIARELIYIPSRVLQVAAILSSSQANSAQRTMNRHSFPNCVTSSISFHSHLSLTLTNVTRCSEKILQWAYCNPHPPPDHPMGCILHIAGGTWFNFYCYRARIAYNSVCVRLSLIRR